jgi:hypothetical protein
LPAGPLSGWSVIIGIIIISALRLRRVSVSVTYGSTTVCRRRGCVSVGGAAPITVPQEPTTGALGKQEQVLQTCVQCAVGGDERPTVVRWISAHPSSMRSLRGREEDNGAVPCMLAGRRRLQLRLLKQDCHLIAAGACWRVAKHHRNSSMRERRR